MEKDTIELGQIHNARSVYIPKPTLPEPSKLATRPRAVTSENLFSDADEATVSTNRVGMYLKSCDKIGEGSVHFESSTSCGTLQKQPTQLSYIPPILGFQKREREKA